MRRGEVWWAEIPKPVGARPVVILTRNQVLDSIGGIVVGLVTRTQRGLNSEVPLGRAEGLPRQSVVNLDKIMTLPRGRFVRQLGSLSQVRIHDLDRSLVFALGIGG